MLFIAGVTVAFVVVQHGAAPKCDVNHWNFVVECFKGAVVAAAIAVMWRDCGPRCGFSIPIFYLEWKPKNALTISALVSVIL